MKVTVNKPGPKPVRWDQLPLGQPAMCAETYGSKSDIYIRVNTNPGPTSGNCLALADGRPPEISWNTEHCLMLPVEITEVKTERRG